MCKFIIAILWPTFKIFVVSQNKVGYIQYRNSTMILPIIYGRVNRRIDPS